MPSIVISPIISTTGHGSVSPFELLYVSGQRMLLIGINKWLLPGYHMWCATSEAATGVGQLFAESACFVPQLGLFPLSASSVWIMPEPAVHAYRLAGRATLGERKGRGQKCSPSEGMVCNCSSATLSFSCAWISSAWSR